MKFKVMLSAILAVIVLAGCASGANDEQSAAPTGSQKSESANNLAQNNEEKKICKVRAITGSRFKQKTCMTAKEWENMSYESKKMLDEDTRSKPTNY